MPVPTSKLSILLLEEIRESRFADLCKEHWSGGRMLPCKGLGADKRKTVGGGPIIHSENRTKHPPYVMVVNVDVNVAKDQIAQMLAKTVPGPGFAHIPSGAGGAPIRALTSM